MTTSIPKAPFVSAVEELVEDGQVEPVLGKFNEMLMSYRKMEWGIQQRKTNLETKIPELEKSLKVVEELERETEENHERIVQFELADSLYANARLPQKVSSVGVWLGANVMLDYTIGDAIELLSEKVEMAKNSLKVVNEDLSFIREQVTTMEVNIARVYNWDVKRRRELKASQ